MIHSICDIENETFPPGFKPPIHGLRSEIFTAELFDLLVTVHKISVYQVPTQNSVSIPINFLDFIQSYAHVLKCLIVKISAQNVVYK